MLLKLYFIYSLVIVTEAAKLGFGYNRSGNDHSSLKSEIMKYKTSECGGSSSEENYNRTNRKRNKGAQDSDESDSNESDEDDSESGEKKKKGNRSRNNNPPRNNKKRNRQESDSNEYGSFPRYGMMDKRQNDYTYGGPESNPYQTTWNDRNHQYGSEYPNRQGSQNNFGYPSYPNRNGNPTNDYPNRNFGNPMTPNSQYPSRPGYPNTPNRPGYPNSRPGYPNIDPYQPNGQRPYNRGQDPFQNHPYPNRGQEQFGNGQDQNRRGYPYGGDRPYQDRDDSRRNPYHNKGQQSDSEERGNPEHRRNGYNNNRGGGNRNKANGGRRNKRPSKDESSEDECVSQCVFNNMEIMEDDGIPSESAMIKWAQDKIMNDKLRGTGVKEIRKCFGTLASSDGDNSCNFSKSLAACLKLDLDEDK